MAEGGERIEAGEGTFSVSQMMERFLFDGALQHSVIGKLSGGERRRLYLLRILMGAPNVLFLDEPTNDLDIETLTILEEYLLTFPGVVIAVSHDRYFLDKMAQSIFEVRGDGEVRFYAGNYSDYLDKRQEESAPAEKKTPQPKKQPSNTPKRKFTYGEQREYETIEDDIAAIEDEIAEVDRMMVDASSDYVKLQELMDRKSTLEAKLEEKTERWLYLEELAEELGLK